MIELEFIDEERIPLLEWYNNIDDSIYEDQETSINDDASDQQEATRAELDTEINALEREFNVKIPPEERSNFRVSSGYLQVEKSPGEYTNISKSYGKFIAESTIHTRLGVSLARRLLGIKTPSTSKAYSRVLLKDLDIKMDELPPQRLEKCINEVMNSVSTNIDLDMWEFVGIDKAKTRIQGELANNARKLTESDAHIARVPRKFSKIKTSPNLQVNEERIKTKIVDLKEEQVARLELLSQNRKELTSQFSQIGKTVKNFRWRSQSSRKAPARLQKIRANHHCCINLNRPDHLYDSHCSHRWSWFFNISKKP